MVTELLESEDDLILRVALLEVEKIQSSLTLKIFASRMTATACTVAVALFLLFKLVRRNIKASRPLISSVNFFQVHSQPASSSPLESCNTRCRKEAELKVAPLGQRAPLVCDEEIAAGSSTQKRIGIPFTNAELLAKGSMLSCPFINGAGRIFAKAQLKQNCDQCMFLIATHTSGCYAHKCRIRIIGQLSPL